MSAEAIITVRVPPAVKRDLLDLARMRQQSLSDLVRALIDKELEL